MYSPKDDAVTASVAPCPTPEELRAVLDRTGGLTSAVAPLLGRTPNALYALVRYHPELREARREWLAARGLRRVLPGPTGRGVSDAAVARALDAASSMREVAGRLGYSISGMHAVVRASGYRQSLAAYGRMRDRQRRAVQDPRAALVRRGIEALRAALPAHGRYVRAEWRAAAAATGPGLAGAWAEAEARLRGRRAADRTSDQVEAVVALAELVPEPGWASRGIGAHWHYVGNTIAAYPQVGRAYREAYARRIAASDAERMRRMRRDWWDARYGAEVRRQRAAEIDAIWRAHGTVAAWERATGGTAPTRGCVEGWIRQDPELYRPGLYPRRPPSPAVPGCDPALLARPALVLREVATGDRWWQWGEQVAWVGDRAHSARLMLDQAVRGEPMMVARIEAVPAGEAPPDERPGWVADSRVARWSPATGRAEWGAR